MCLPNFIKIEGGKQFWLIHMEKSLLPTWKDRFLIVITCGKLFFLECWNVYVMIVSEHKTVETGEEVILNTMTTINNLSFYVCHPSAIIKHQLQLAHGW